MTSSGPRAVPLVDPLSLWHLPVAAAGPHVHGLTSAPADELADPAGCICFLSWADVDSRRDSARSAQQALWGPAGPRWGEPERACRLPLWLARPQWCWQDHLLADSLHPLAPDAGSVQIAGIDALADPRAAREQLGYVAQEVAIDKILSGHDSCSCRPASITSIRLPVAAALMSSLSSSAWASGSIAAAAPIPVACAGAWIC